jgi:hypothetical protein
MINFFNNPFTNDNTLEENIRNLNFINSNKSSKKSMSKTNGNSPPPPSDSSTDSNGNSPPPPSDSPPDTRAIKKPVKPKDKGPHMSSLTRKVLFAYFGLIILSSGFLLIYGLDYHFCANVLIEKKIAENQVNDTSPGKDTKGTTESEFSNCTKFGTGSITKILTTAEGWYALIASMFGALGGAVHALSSLTTWRGTNKLESSWTQWYIARPLVGAAISFIIYVIVRAGYFDSSTVINEGSLPISVYGIAAIGALVGFMSSAATQKLKDVFDTVFGIQKPNKERGDVPKQGAETEISIEENIEIYIDEIKDINARFTNSVGIPQKNIPVTFIFQNNKIASFVNKEEDNIIVKKTDSLGMVNIQIKGLNEGNTFLAIVTKVGENTDNKIKFNDVAKSIEIIVKKKLIKS